MFANIFDWGVWLVVPNHSNLLKLDFSRLVATLMTASTRSQTEVFHNTPSSNDACYVDSITQALYSFEKDFKRTVIEC